MSDAYVSCIWWHFGDVDDDDDNDDDADDNVILVNF